MQRGRGVFWCLVLFSVPARPFGRALVSSHWVPLTARRAARLIAAAYSAGNQVFCDDSFFKIDKMVDALLVVFPSG